MNAEIMYSMPLQWGIVPTEAEIGLFPATRFLAQRAINTL